MAAHRYWRLNLTAPVSGTAYGVAEITMAIAAGGANQCTGGTAAASTSYSASYLPANAFDASAASFWASAGGTAAEWISYDFGVGITRDIVEFSFQNRPDGIPAQTPYTGALQWSDDNTTWTTTLNFTGSTSPTTSQIQTFPPFTLVGAYFDALNKTAAFGLNSSATIATSSAVASVADNRPLSGLTYSEFVITTLAGTPAVGLVNAFYNMGTATLLGGDINSLGYRSGGAVVANSVTLATLAAFVQGDRIDVACDPGNSLIWFRVNGGNWNNDILANQNPVGAVGGIDTSSIRFTRTFLAVGASITGTVITAHFLAASFVGTAPTGYVTPATVSYNRAPAQQTSVARAVFSPAGPITVVSGFVKEAGVAVVGRKVEVYDRATGELLGSTVSGAGGAWSIPALGRTAVRVVGSDPTTYNSMVFDNVVPA